MNIRHFWRPEGTSEKRATRKGVALNFDQYTRLKEFLKVLTDRIPELRHRTALSTQLQSNVNALLSIV